LSNGFDLKINSLHDDDSSVTANAQRQARLAAVVEFSILCGWSEFV
jgi:hypothetical protein